MKFKLTGKYQHSQHLKNGKRRSLIKYFLNGVLILEQKVPFDENMEYGYPKNMPDNEYLLNGKLHQTREGDRKVYYPISKKKLEQFNIPQSLKIYLTPFDLENFKKRKSLKKKLNKIK